jgi:4a-hydroxytetrahydrobiopterin dehydratase
MADEDLVSRHCTPCEKDQEPLKGSELDDLADRIDDDWKVQNEHHLEREFDFDDFRQALDFTNAVGEIAEKEDHHPDIELGYGRVKVTIFTHNIDGLSENDFILAAKADEALKSM